MAKIIILLLFFTSLVIGQLGRIDIAPGVAIYLHEPLILLLLIIWVIRKKDFLKQFVNRNLSVPIQLFVFIQLISLIIAMPYNTNAQILVGLFYILRFILYASLYWTVGDLWSTSTILIGLYGWGLLVSVLGLVQFVLYPNLRNLSYLGWDPHYYRLFSTYFDPNFTGIIIVMTLILGWLTRVSLRDILMAKQSLIVKKDRHAPLAMTRYADFVIFISLIINLIALLLTFSRSSLLALAVTVIVLSLWKRKWVNIIVVSGLAITVLLITQFGSQTQDLLRLDTSSARLANWQEGIAIFLQSPLIGHGFNLVRYVRMNNDPLSHAASGFDNSFIFVLATTGLVGFSAFIYLIFRMMKIGSLYTATLIAVIIHSLFTNSFFYPWVMAWLWILFSVSNFALDH